MKKRYLSSVSRRMIVGAFAFSLLSSVAVAQDPNSFDLIKTEDSLAGFNADKVMNTLMAKQLEPWEVKLAMEKAKRRYINRKYNIAQNHTPYTPPPTPQAPCTNMDFETGNFTGWSGWIGDNSLSSSGPLQNLVSGIFSTGMNALLSDANARHTIMSVAGGNDPCGGFPVVAPGGNYSVRLGGTTANYQGEILEQTFTVAPGNTSFTYQYAVVLNDGGHSAGEQPYFKIEMIDQSGGLIPCSQYYVEASGSIPGFQTCGVGTSYKPWTTVNINLATYVAQNVTIRFTAAGCIYAGHYGYAYIDASCLPYQISQNDSLCAGSSINISAPVGAQSYSWAPTGQTSQTINVTTPGTYSVTMTSVTGCTTMLTHVVAQYPQPTATFTYNSPNCTTLVNFTNTSTCTNNGAMTYTWDFGDGSPTSNLQSPSHNYPAGTFTVTLIATGVNGGCADTITAIVNPANGGQAAFSNTSECLNNPTQFTDLSVGSTGWSWDFGEPSSGGNNVSSLQNPSHTYGAPGTYTVTLTATTLPCPSVVTQIITVYPLPTAAFTYGGSCTSLTVNFTDNSTVTNPNTITGWNWNFGDPASGANNISNLQNPPHTFSAAGNYTVILTVTTSDGCQSTINLPISVGAPPTALFATTPVCTNTPMQFTDQSTGASQYFWDFGTIATNDTSNLQNPSYTFTQSGTFTVTLIASAGSGCSDTATLQVTVNPGPAPAFAAPAVCETSTTSFTDQSVVSSGTITNWSWDFGVTSQTGDTSNLQNPTFVYPTAGTYTVTLTVTSNNGCQTTMTQVVNVNPLPTAQFTNSPACSGAPMNFTDQSLVTSGNVTTWAWDFGDGSPVNNTQNPSHNYGTSSSTYTVTLIVGTSNGCTDTIAQTITLNPIPVALFVADTTQGCAPLCINFTDQSSVTPGSITGWTWDFGDGSVPNFTQNPQHCYLAPGTYDVTLTATTNQGCVATLNIPAYITAHPSPVASFSATPQTTTILNTTVSFTDLSSGSPISWSWDFGDFATDNVQNPVHTYNPDLSYSYDVTLSIVNQYGCVDDTTITILVEPEFTFYIPNAFTPNGDGKNDVFFGTGIGIDKYDIWIFDRWGNMIFHGDDLADTWDGKVQGKSQQICQEDVYVWKVILTDVFAKKHKYIGHVSLIR
ncbi:MAG: PKD domain-containing protein [Bacteroidetes bacterium]|nr:MAG: PKD domain-containing protein [Bacteroidota bacterium]